MRLLHTLIPLALVFSACKPKEEDPIDSDSGRDTTVHSDTQEDTHSDTEPVDTSSDSDTDTTLTSIPDIRDNTGGWVAGDTLRTEGIVTALRTSGTQRGFILQDAHATEKAALLVLTSATPPQVGSAVTVTGSYAELGLGTSTQSLTTLSADATGISVSGSVDLPAWTTLSTTVASANSEAYELMLVRLQNPSELLTVTSAPNPTSGLFGISGAGSTWAVSAVFYPLSQDYPTLGAGDTFSYMGGVLWRDANTGNPQISPRATSDAGTWTSKDTGGTGTVTPGITSLQPGEVVITEIMATPIGCGSNPNGQYVELTSTRSSDIDLVGLRLNNNAGGSFTIPTSTLLSPGERLVLYGSSSGANCLSIQGMSWGSSFQINAGGDILSIANTTQTIDSVPFLTGFPLVPGSAMELYGPTSASANDAAGAWCEADTLASAGNYGTPGAPNTCEPYVDTGDTDDTDEPIDTFDTDIHDTGGAAAPIDGTYFDLHRSNYGPGRVVRFYGLVVTAIAGRGTSTSVNDHEFAVQDPAGGDYSGFWVYKGLDDALMPVVGQIVDLECPMPEGSILSASGDPNRPGIRSNAMLDCSNVSKSTITIQGLAALPAPVEIPVSMLTDNGGSTVTAPLEAPGEIYEGRLVRVKITDPADHFHICDTRRFGNTAGNYWYWKAVRLAVSHTSQGKADCDAEANVSSNPVYYFGGFISDMTTLSTRGDPVINPGSTIGRGIGDTFTEITGVLRYHRYVAAGNLQYAIVNFDIYPTASSDVVGYIDNPPAP